MGIFSLHDLGSSVFTHVARHQERPKHNSEEKAIVLKMNVVDDEEAWVEEKAGRQQTLHSNVFGTVYKSASM